MQSSILGAVLVGGDSRRMGQDKARLRLGGRPLAVRAAACLASRLREVVVVSRRRGDHADLGLPEIADRFPGLGPLAAIDAALRHAAGRHVFALACDLPRVGPGEIAEVLAAAAAAKLPTGAAWCVVAAAAGRVQPLCGIYAAGCGPVIEERLRAGRLAAAELLGDVECVTVPLTAGRAAGDGPLANLNRPEQARRLGVENLALPSSSAAAGPRGASA